ncbi:M50 family metallopeptidase [Dethiobacter alkaliphilus]|uniref:Peptidase M50 domain-containing protein n=1 Tax=Dethiobacter alkaliphilus AHT 1 TaxID=555088 RepID=C0GCB6_DETAL|nr:M50 family metallopeptidase [Dethiobacter alkaliphilus]EEG78851.1 hypothetical protein DealDRAFT_0125 [Dethiobacter alkaliphilus AHT 1]
MSNILPVVLMAIPSYFVVVTIHELGHILTGLFHGFKFHLFVIGPIGLKRNEQDKVVFYFEKNPSLWGGVGGAVPKTEDSVNFMAFARVLIAGPLVSLVFGGIMLYLFILIDHPFLLLLGAMSVAISIGTLIPSRSGAFYSDGGRWLRIVRNTKARAVELALFNLIQSAIIHQCYAHINIADTQPLIDYEDHREQYFGHLYAMNYYKEHGDNRMAEKHGLELKTLESKVPKSFIKLMGE